MITDRFGNKGFDRNNDKKLSQDEIDIKGTAAGGYGQKIHTRAQESGLPDAQHKMWTHYDLQNKCDTSDINTCKDNINCKIDPTNQKKCLYMNQAMTQNQWVSKQSSHCNTLIKEDTCTNNNFCDWEGKKKTCFLDKKYHKVSGLNKEDEFKKDSTLSDVLGRINNGRVSDANITSNVTHTSRGEVLMEHDNQKTSVKGIVDETALSTIFFSEVNTNIIQQTMRYKVYEKTNEVVHQQSPEALYIVMRSILLQHGNFRVDSINLALEIRKLNFLVVKYCVNEVSSNVLQYKGYINDLEKLPTPMDRPDYNDHGSRNRTFNMSNHI